MTRSIFVITSCAYSVADDADACDDTDDMMKEQMFIHAFGHTRVACCCCFLSVSAVTTASPDSLVDDDDGDGDILLSTSPASSIVCANKTSVSASRASAN